MFQIEFSMGEERNVLLLVGQGRKNAVSLLVAFESLLFSTMHQSRQNLKKKISTHPLKPNRLIHVLRSLFNKP